MTFVTIDPTDALLVQKLMVLVHDHGLSSDGRVRRNVL